MSDDDYDWQQVFPEPRTVMAKAIDIAVNPPLIGIREEDVLCPPIGGTTDDYMRWLKEHPELTKGREDMGTETDVLRMDELAKAALDDPTDVTVAEIREMAALWIKLVARVH